MAWLTNTKTGKPFNTDWLEEDEQKKYAQIAKNQAESSRLNGKPLYSKRVDQKDLTQQKIIEEIAGKDSYALSPEYHKWSEDVRTLHQRSEDIRSKIKELETELKQESTLKPRNEWTTSDEVSALLGEKPVSYTHRGKEINAQIDRLRKERQEIDKQREASVEKLKYADKLRSRDIGEKHTREKISSTLKDDYFGFKKSESTTPYIDDMLKSGKAVVVSMSPKAYIEEASWNIFGSSVEKTLRGRSAKDVAKYMTMMEQGTKFDTPYLNYRDEQQEGLHRAISAYMLGIDEIPVIVVRKK